MSGQIVFEEQIVKIPRGYPLPNGWQFSRLIYETTELDGRIWDAMLVFRGRNPEDTQTTERAEASSDGR